MRIAIYHDLPSGGAKRALLEITRRLASDHYIELFSLSSADEEFADLRPFVMRSSNFSFQPLPLFRSPFGRLNQALRLVDLFRLRLLNRRIAAQIDDGTFDVVFVQPCQFEISPSLLRFLNTPTVYFCQEPLRRLYESMPVRPYDSQESTMRRTMDRIDPLPGLYHAVLRQGDRAHLWAATQVLVNSQFVSGAVKDIYGRAPRVSYLGVDTELFSPQTGPKQPFVISVGSLTPLKGFDFLIRSLATIRAGKRPLLKIVCNFANPEELAYLQQLSRSSGVDIELAQGITDSQLVELYNKALVTVYAPIREPFGLVTLESMACETPVVAVGEGGILETVIDGETGMLTPRDEQAFATALQTLLEDQTRRERMGERGRAYVESNWTWQTAAERVEHTLLSVRSGGPDISN